MKPIVVSLCTALVLCGVARSGRAQDVHLLIVTGLEGDQEHGEIFHKWAVTLIDAAKRRNGLKDPNIGYLAENPARDASRTGGRSTREGVMKAFADLATRAGPGDDVFIVLIGHGSFDGRDARFNLPGPDLSAPDWAKLLEKLPSERVVFVNASSASGGFLAALAAPGRTIVTATKTGGERNEPRFPAYFVEAFAGEAADQDQDGRVSVLEAFKYATAKVAQVYQQEGLLQSEHAALDDGRDGNLAAGMFLGPNRARAEAIAAIADPALRALRQEQQSLEEQVAALRLRKAGMGAGPYEQAMEKLLTDLAKKTREIREREAKP